MQKINKAKSVLFGMVKTIDKCLTRIIDEKIKTNDQY
jgi:hypothetical protein